MLLGPLSLLGHEPDLGDWVEFGEQEKTKGYSRQGE